MSQSQPFKTASFVRQFLIFVAIAVVIGLVLQAIWSSSPSVQRQKAPKVAKITIEALPVVEQDYPIKVHSFGTVQPRTQSFLVAQVSGQVMKVNPNFRPGGFFEVGDELLLIDDRDYKAEVEIAKATLITAEQTLQEEQARSAQALHDWERLEQKGEPSALVLRKPQLHTAEANLQSAKARLYKAELALSRTRVVAPFAGRVLQQLVDVGRVVGVNTQLAQVYASNYVEVRLPINNRDLAFLDLPEEYRGGKVYQVDTPVTLQSNLMGDQSWQAELVRTEGAIDSNAQQLYVVAQVHDPFRAVDANTANDGISASKNLRIGQYVTAEIRGKTVKSAIAIPNQAIYQGSYVYVFKEGKAFRRDVGIRWQNSEESLIAYGLEAGELVITTPLGQVNSGTAVQLQDEARSLERSSDVARAVNAQGAGK